jgi:hypothetical protein
LLVAREDHEIRVRADFAHAHRDAGSGVGRAGADDGRPPQLGGQTRDCDVVDARLELPDRRRLADPVAPARNGSVRLGDDAGDERRAGGRLERGRRGRRRLWRRRSRSRRWSRRGRLRRGRGRVLVVQHGYDERDAGERERGESCQDQ